MIRIAVANQKGGVGKTTTCINLATALAAIGWRVFWSISIRREMPRRELGSRRRNASFLATMCLSGGLRLSKPQCRPAFRGWICFLRRSIFRGAEVEMVSVRLRASPRRTLGRLASGRWDICLIDCPPSLGLLTINALVAARYLLVPLQCEFFALEGLSQLLQTVERLRIAFNPELSILGVALTMFDRRNNLSQAVAEDVRACLGPAVFDTIVPRNVRLSEAPSHGLPALIYDLRCPGRKPTSGLLGSSSAVSASRRGRMNTERGGKGPGVGKGLGMGLQALLGEAGRAPETEAQRESRGGVREIEISSIRPNPDQPRTQFDEPRSRSLLRRSVNAACYSLSCFVPTATDL